MQVGALVGILSSKLPSATMVTDLTDTKHPGTMGIGHFFLAIDTGLFRDPADFRRDVVDFTDSLRATRPADPARPVMVAGDPERRNAARRKQEGSRLGLICWRRSRGLPRRAGRSGFWIDNQASLGVASSARCTACASPAIARR